MFRITRKADYAVFILSTLARRAAAGGELTIEADTGDSKESRTLGSSGVHGDLVSAQALAEFSSLDKSLVANLLKDLTRAGFLTSVRGARGGYKLAMDADDITFEAILEAVEGPFSFVECADHLPQDAAAPTTDAQPVLSEATGGETTGGESAAQDASADAGPECCNLLSLCASQGALLYVHHRIRDLLRDIKLTQLAGLDPDMARRHAQELFPLPNPVAGATDSGSPSDSASSAQPT